MVLFRSLVTVIFGLGVCLSTGCGTRSSAKVGAISGKVSVKGAPLTGGFLKFHAKDGHPVASLRVEMDGTYTGAVPLGELLVAVDTESTRGEDPEEQAKQGGKGPEFMGTLDPKAQDRLKEYMMKNKEKKLSPEEMQKLLQGDAPKSKVKYVPIPEKYRKATDSGLTVTIQAGNNTKDFQIP